MPCIPNVHMCDFTHTGRVGREEDSLFVYRGSDTYSSINNDTGFTPQFGVDLDSIPPNVSMLCGDNTQCLYDYVQTGDVGLAESTASEEMELQNTRNSLGKCSVSNVPLCIYTFHVCVLYVHTSLTYYYRLCYCASTVLLLTP